MNILISGGTGYIGYELCQKLKSHQLYVITRKQRANEKNIHYLLWDDLNKLKDIDIVINLAGENISSGLWTKKQKRKIYSSRINSTKRLKHFIENSSRPIQLLVQGSAIGYYGYEQNELKDESSKKGNGFLADTVDDWENTVRDIKNVQRTVFLRFGLVFSRSSILYKKLSPIIKIYLGAIPGNGRNYISWVHLNDLINAVLFLMKNEKCHGVYNIVNPKAILAEAFYLELAKSLNRPILFKIPGFLLRFFLGDMAKEVILANQRSVPKHLLNDGFVFKHNVINK